MLVRDKLNMLNVIHDDKHKTILKKKKKKKKNDPFEILTLKIVTFQAATKAATKSKIWLHVI